MIERDSLFRIASMTKPIVAVAAAPPEVIQDFWTCAYTALDD